MQKYYNPRLHNAVVAGTGMEHPRRPHVVLGSELNGYVQGDLVDANGICDLIHEKNVNTFAKLESLETSLKNESKARIEGMYNLSEQMDRIIAEKLGSTETVYGESIQRVAEDERLQLQINDLNSKYTALWNSLSALNTTVNGKQDTLVAGNNIKNISDGTNTVSLLGAGDIRFKTINGQSILGDEDIPVVEGTCKNNRYTVEQERDGRLIRDNVLGERISTEEYVSLHTMTNVISYNDVYYYLHSVHPDYVDYTPEQDNDTVSISTDITQGIAGANIISIYKRLDAPTELDAYSDSDSTAGLLTAVLQATYSKVSVDEIYITDNGVYFDTELGNRAISLDDVATLGDVWNALASMSNRLVVSHAEQEFTPFSYGSVQDLYLVRFSNTEVLFASKHGNAMIYIVAAGYSEDDTVTIYNLTKDYRYIINQYSENNMDYTTVRDLFTNTQLDPKEVHLYTDTIADNFTNNLMGRIYKLVNVDSDVIRGKWDGNYPKVISSYAVLTFPRTIDIGAVSSPTSEAVQN